MRPMRPPIVVAALALAVPALALADPAAPGPSKGGGERRGDGAAPRTPASVAAIVKKAVETYGGKPAFARTAARREEGTVTSLLHPGDTGRIVRLSARPGRLRVEVEYPGAPKEIRVLDGGRGWRNGEVAEGPRLDAMRLQETRLDVVARLAEPGARIADGGTAMVGGTVVRVLSLSPAPGLTVEAQIDPVTGRVLRTRGASGGPHAPAAFETTYGDFRKVDGVLVAFHEWSWANGKSTGETVLKKVEFPRELPPGTFAP